MRTLQWTGMRPGVVRLGVSAALLAAVLGTAGCGDDGDEDGDGEDVDAVGTECDETPASAVPVSGPLAAFDLDGVATPVHVVEEDGFFVVNAVAEGKISDLAITFVDIVEDAGFNLAGSDDEGFEAEVFFARGDFAAGQVVLTESDCEGLVDVKISLVDDPSVLPEDTDAPPTTSS